MKLCVIWPFNQAIGSGMTNNFVMSDNRIQLFTHGTRSTGSYGYELPILFVSRRRSQTDFQAKLVSEIDLPLFQKELAGLFRPGSTALAANITTPASNVAQNTQAASVSLNPIQPVSEVKVKEERLKQRVLHSPPVTPVKVDRLKFFLHGYDRALANYLIDGFRFGFRVNFVGERLAYESPNLKSAIDQPDLVQAKLSKECAAGRIVGPFTTPPFPNLRTSPLGIVPKKDPSEFRLIHHLSYPDGSSVNDFIPDVYSTVKYASVGDASKSIKQLGRGCFMAKTDVKSAFRIVPIHPADYSLLGMKWANLYYFDRTLPMGLSSSCSIFEAVSTALEWISSHHLGATSVLHILDDFLFIAPTKDQCRRDLSNFVSLCEYIGVPLAPEKTVGPSSVLQFAGIILDSERMEARLPDDKLTRCRRALTDFLARRSVCLKELQSLIGLLNFTCLVVVPGRAFLRRLIDLTKGVRKPYHHIRLSKGAKLDLALWLRFLQDFNGKSFFLDDVWETSDTLTLYTDSAGSIGFGAVFGNRWLHGLWPASWTTYNIAILEFFPIVGAVHIWGSLMADKCVLFYSDNAAVVDIINKQTSKDSTIMVLLRDLVLSCLNYNILFQAHHIPGLINSRPDYLSRFQVAKFKELAPEADVFPTPVPENLMQESWFLH